MGFRHLSPADKQDTFVLTCAAHAAVVGGASISACSRYADSGLSEVDAVCALRRDLNVVQLPRQRARRVRQQAQRVVAAVAAAGVPAEQREHLRSRVAAKHSALEGESR